jgi:hypothetical protein
MRNNCATAARNGCAIKVAGKMIRFVALFVLLAVAAFLVTEVARRMKDARIDWTGVAFAVGFVVLAFWLRHVTGMG